MSEFWSMGGYGLYIWGSYGVCAIVMVIEPLLVLQRQRRAALAAKAVLDEEN